MSIRIQVHIHMHIHIYMASHTFTYTYCIYSHTYTHTFAYTSDHICMYSNMPIITSCSDPLGQVTWAVFTLQASPWWHSGSKTVKSDEEFADCDRSTHICQSMHICNVKSGVWENWEYGTCVASTCMRPQTTASISAMKANSGPLSGSKADTSHFHRNLKISKSILDTESANPNWKTLRRTKAGTTGSPSPDLSKGLFTHFPYA